MKKGLLFTLVFMFLSVGALIAQWEKMAEQDLIDGSFKFSSGIDLAHFKGVTVIGTEIDGNNQLYYSKNIGKKWSKMKMPTTTNNSKSGYFNQLVFNELGIFFVDKYNSVNAEVEVEIYNTKDLGQTWQKFTVKFPALAVSDFFELTSVDSNVYLLHLPNYGNYGVTYVYKYDIKNNNWALFDDLYSDNKSEYGQFYNVSKNRIVYSKNSIVNNLNKVYILNSSNKVELLKFNSKSPNEDYPNLRLKSANCIAEDSTIVYVYRKTEQDKTFYVEVSINLGKTWQTSTIGNFDRFPSISPISRTFFYPRIQIDKNKIYITGSHSTFISEDFGVNWKSITVNLNPDNNAQIDIGNRIDKFIVSDSLHFAFKNQRLFTKNVKDTNWNHANNVSSNFLGLRKINDSLISASVFNAYLESSNQGKIWKAFPFDTSVSVRIKTDKFLLGTRGGITFRSFDSAKTWSVDSIFPKYLVDVVVSGDTIVLMSEDSTFRGKEILYFTGLPYNKPNLLRKIYSVGTGSILYLNGIVYYATNDSLGRKTLGIKRLKIDGTALSDVFTDERLIPGTLMNSNNKVYGLIANQYGYSVKGLGFSDDFGITWKKYAMPTGVGTYVKIDKFLFGSTFVPKQCGSLNQSDGGIYVSADDGKSWYRYNDGINTNCNNFQANFTQIDSFIFAYSSFGLWRTKLSNFNLKSLSGTVFIDKNKNGIKDTDEKGFPNAKVFLSNAGAFTTADSLGNYAFLADLKTTDTLKASVDSKYVTYTPQYLLVSQSDTVKNIGVFIPNIQDLVMNGTAITPPRSGFANSYLLTYKNVGAITKSGKVTFTYNAKQTYVEATQAPTSNANNTLSWDYANLQPNETRTLKVTFKTAADVPIRTQLTNVATIEPIATDTFKTDNVDSLFQIVVGSYDPNDKQVSFLNTRQAPSVIDPNTEMTYTIRFQNTGNYQADFVRVTDTLSDKLDLTTLRVLATSHNYTLSVKNKNVLQFEFNPIYLPDSTTNEKESHGFIKFAIKPKKTLTKDEVIKNTAYIFFDYNPAIITNTVETANQKVNGLFTPSVFETLSVFPNPTNGEISFSLDKYQGKALSINVYSIDGKLMMNKHAVGEAVNRINGEGLRNGLYVLQVRVGDEIVFGRFMVQK